MSVDLSSLEEFTLEPDWEKEKPLAKEKAKADKRYHESKKISKPIRNKKKSVTKRAEILDVTFVPDDNILKIIKEKIKFTGISFTLKEICDSVCSEKNRIKIKLSLKDKKMRFLILKEHNKIFLDVETAIKYLIDNHFHSLFKVIKLRNEKTKNKPSYILKCPVTKTIFPPKSHHNFETLIKQHLVECENRNYDDFVSKLTKSDDTIEIESYMKKGHFINRYILKDDPSLFTDNIEGIELLTEKCTFVKNIRKEKIFVIKLSDIGILGERLIRDIDSILGNKSMMKKQIITSLLISFKKSKFHVHRERVRNQIVISANKKTQASDTNLNAVATAIVSMLKKQENHHMSKRKLINHNNMSSFTKEKIIKDLRWLVKEGFILELSNGEVMLY